MLDAVRSRMQQAILKWGRSGDGRVREDDVVARGAEGNLSARAEGRGGKGGKGAKVARWPAPSWSAPRARCTSPNAKHCHSHCGANRSPPPAAMCVWTFVVTARWTLVYVDFVGPFQTCIVNVRRDRSTMSRNVAIDAARHRTFVKHG